MTRTRHPLLVCTLLTALATNGIAIAREGVDFRSGLEGDLPDGPFGLEVLWNRELGSGYSNVTMVDGKAFTMFTAGEVDVIAAIDAASGAELWRYELGETYRGHTGSEDGPLSTPAIVDGRVFVLGPRGNVAALSFTDGSEIWTHQLDEESSTPPFYGYTTSPILFGDLVIFATGGEGRAVTAFDQATGEIRWTAGNDTVTYQTPTLFELGGQPTLVAATDFMIQGFDPHTGALKFEHRHTEGQQNEESAHVIPIDGEGFVVNFSSGAVMYRLAGDGIEEVWRSQAFGNSLAIPVVQDGYLYGFTGRFLTAADVDTGEIAWRSRPPLARGLSLIDGRLAVLAADGELVLIEASPDGYHELARVTVFEDGDYAMPAFADGRFLVRNVGRMAAVDVDTDAAPRVAEVDPMDFLAGEMAEWVSSVLALPEGERQAAVDERFAGVETAPLVEGGIVHFFWRGDAEDVGLEGDLMQGTAENGLVHVPGTDLFVRSVEADPKAQYTYAFTVDYGDASTDPLNPYTVDNGFNVVSELRMPEWPASPHLEEPAEGAPRGELDTFPFRSEILDNTRQIQVWRPAGYGSGEARYPLLVVNHGDNLLRGGLMRNTLDNLVGQSVAPLIAVFVPRLSPAEYGGERVDDYVRFLVEELIPHLDRHYLTDGETRAIMGPGSAGVTAVYTALAHGDLFQKAAVQSFYPIEPAQDRFAEMAPAADPKPELIYVVWSHHDYDFNNDETAKTASKGLIEILEGAGIEVTEQVASYSPAWGGWRGQHDDILEALFPADDGS